MSVIRNVLHRNLGLRIVLSSSKMTYSNGGPGGSIRDAGGAFSKKGRFEEEDYFRKLQREQLAKMKTEMEIQISHHEEQILHHQNAIKRHRLRLKEMVDTEEEEKK